MCKALISVWRADAEMTDRSRAGGTNQRSGKKLQWYKKSEVLDVAPGFKKGVAHCCTSAAEAAKARALALLRHWKQRPNFWTGVSGCL